MRFTVEPHFFYYFTEYLKKLKCSNIKNTFYLLNIHFPIMKSTYILKSLRISEFSIYASSRVVFPSRSRRRLRKSLSFILFPFFPRRAFSFLFVIEGFLYRRHIIHSHCLSYFNSGFYEIFISGNKVYVCEDRRERYLSVFLCGKISLRISHYCYL